MVLPIILYGNPILRKKCLDIDLFSYKKEINQLIKDMFDTVNQSKGIGLAAPQIGKNIRIFIVKIPNLNKKNSNGNNNYYEEVFINSKILNTYGKEYKFNEGCLSIPGIMGDIKRRSNILIEYYDHNLKKKRKNITGLCARVILHEYDHLNGKLFIDYFPYKERKKIEKKLIDLL
ncbi:peptide deformylase [Blattabacterium cuenoti]|uniref:peptide deformylase n=1 Tax=Blattabacterium cuenoti TaxID=1653831 RepID=UPI00163C25FB|nr:peptide deformylase [Blattabacterium cuenoti]